MSRGFTIHVFISFYLNSIIEKVESQNLVTSEQSTSRFLKKTIISYPLIHSVRNISFLENLASFVFL